MSSLLDTPVPLEFDRASRIDVDDICFLDADVKVIGRNGRVRPQFHIFADDQYVCTGYCQRYLKAEK